jgi:hypothetical protein
MFDQMKIAYECVSTGDIVTTKNGSDDTKQQRKNFFVLLKALASECVTAAHPPGPKRSAPAWSRSSQLRIGE